MDISALQTTPRQQWEPSSGSSWASQSNNCGPTCACFICDFYRDKTHGIEATRRLITGCCAPTTGGQQASMMWARDVPTSSVWVDGGLNQLDAMVGWEGTRPVIVGIEMWRVPASVRDHPFLGWHAVVVICRGTKNGVSGYWVMDPNFSPPGGYRPDPDHGHKFYSRGVMQFAFIDNWSRWSVAPNQHKVVRAIGGLPVDKWVNQAGRAVTIRAGKPRRDQASLNAHNYGTTAKGIPFKLWGSINDGQLVAGSRKWYFGSQYINGRMRVIYVPLVDTRDYHAL